MRVLSSDKKKIYNVTESSCDCLDFMYRRSKVGGKCKHILKYFIEIIDTTTNDIEELRKFFKNGVNIFDAYEKLGDYKIKQLISIGEIVKYKDKFVLLE